MSRSGYDKYMYDALDTDDQGNYIDTFDKNAKLYSWNDLDDIATTIKWFNKNKEIERLENKISQYEALISSNYKLMKEEIEKQVREES